MKIKKLFYLIIIFILTHIIGGCAEMKNPLDVPGHLTGNSNFVKVDCWGFSCNGSPEMHAELWCQQYGRKAIYIRQENVGGDVGYIPIYHYSCK